MKRPKDDGYDLVTVCRLSDCAWPTDMELHSRSWCEDIEGHECFGGPTHQHWPRGHMGGKNPLRRVAGFICSAMQQAVDNGQRIDGRGYSDRVAPATADHGPQYIISVKTARAPRVVMVHLIPPDQRIGLPPISYNNSPSKIGEPPMSTEIIAPPDQSWLTPTGLRPLPDDLPYDEWERIGATLKGLHNAVQWAIGDWVRFGEAHYGEKYAQALDATGRSYATLTNIVSVCAAFPDKTSRARELPFRVYAEVAALARSAPEDAQAVLARAEQGGWTREQVRDELRPSIVTTKPLPRFSVVEFRAAFNEWPDRAEYRNQLARGFEAFTDWLAERGGS